MAVGSRSRSGNVGSREITKQRADPLDSRSNKLESVSRDCAAERGWLKNVRFALLCFSETPPRPGRRFRLGAMAYVLAWREGFDRAGASMSGGAGTGLSAARDIISFARRFRCAASLPALPRAVAVTASSAEMRLTMAAKS